MINEMLLREFNPKSCLVTKATEITQPRFPVIDAHNHLAEPFGGGWDKKPLNQLMDVLDQVNVHHYIDLDGGWGEDVFYSHLKKFKHAAPDRFSIFCGIDWSKWPELGDNFSSWISKKLKAYQKDGAEGLKVWKNFGLHQEDHFGKLVDVDDARLSEIWDTAGELGLPILIHVADPVAFFDPVDSRNERWEELQMNPGWMFTSPPFPSFNHIVEGLARLVEAHPQTSFIGAHVGCYAENLAWVGDLLDRCPNFYVDFAARVPEIGRQPFNARKFFIEYSDRILFGLDMGPHIAAYRLYFRFLETDDEYFNYNPKSKNAPDSGRWMIYGLDLPDEVLENIYYRNAEKVLKKKVVNV